MLSMLCITCRQYRDQNRNAQALAKGQREDRAIEEAGTAISLGNRHKESRSKETGLCPIQGEH